MIQKKKSLAFCAAIVAGGAFLLGSGFASAQTTVVNTGTATSTITGTIDISGLDKQKMLTQIQAAISNIQQTLTTILINYAAIQQQHIQNLINSATQQITGSGSATSNPLGGLLSGGTGSGIGSFVTGSGNATTNVTGNAYTNVNGTLTENSGTVSGDTSPGQSTITNSGTISGSTPINTTAIQQQISTIQNQIMSIFSQIGGGSTASTGN